ncbi:MAG: response regulator transcription factor [Gammaproteobacteria bacterium]|nr:response regulator transcription factor [Gammaproteobacteria bacterium]
MRIVLCEDHTLVRAGISALLKSFPDVQVAGEAGDGRKGLALVKKERPDVVLMDIAMPSLNGLQASARIARDCPETKVIFLSMHSNEEYVLQALRTGASGYLLKESATSELRKALDTVAGGDTYLSPAISRLVIDDYLGRVESSKNPLDRLTPRQKEILQLIVEGNSTRKIAEMLHVSTKTVETHRAQLQERLGIYDVPGLVRFAIRVGLISPDM